MLQVIELTEPDELETVRQFWERSSVYPTADYELFLHICQSRKHKVQPYVLAVKDTDQVVALLIGRHENDRRTIRLGYFRMATLRLRSLTFIYGGALGEWNQETSSAILTKLTSLLEQKRIDLITFAYLHEESFLFKTLKDTLRTSRYRHRLAAALRHWEMQLPEPGVDFLGHLNRKSRYNIRRERRKFIEEFGDAIVFRSFRKTEDVDACTMEMEEIASQSYHRAMGVGFTRNQETLTRMKIEARRGRLLVHILYIHNTPIAFWTGVVSNDTFFADYTGFRSDHSGFEPGKLALFSLIESLIESKVARTIDFGFGDAFYKQQLGSKMWNEVSVTVFGRTVVAYWAENFERTIASIEGLLRRFAAKTNVINRIKKLWRKRLSSMSTKE